jgi:hypothetical protein
MGKRPLLPRAVVEYRSQCTSGEDMPRKLPAVAQGSKRSRVRLRTSSDPPGRNVGDCSVIAARA